MLAHRNGVKPKVSPARGETPLPKHPRRRPETRAPHRRLWVAVLCAGIILAAPGWRLLRGALRAHRSAQAYRWLWSWPNPNPGVTKPGPDDTIIIEMSLWDPRYYLNSWLEVYFPADRIRCYREQEFFEGVLARPGADPLRRFFAVLDNPEMSQMQASIHGEIPKRDNAASQLVFALKRWYLAQDEHPSLGSHWLNEEPIKRSSLPAVRRAQADVCRAFEAVVMRFPRARLESAIAQVALGLCSGDPSTGDTRNLDALRKVSSWKRDQPYYAFLARFYLTDTLCSRGRLKAAESEGRSAALAFQRFRNAPSYRELFELMGDILEEAKERESPR